MRKLADVLQLVRWPNLLFIFITQVLFYFSVFYSLVSEGNKNFVFERSGLFFMLVFSSVMIAAAGYIINDYFDVNIDRVNKPSRVIVSTKMNRRWAILFHWLFSFAGIAAGLYVSYKTGKYIIGLANILCVILLWFYSTWFKRKFLIGNVVISALTAWVTMVVYFFAGAKLVYYNGWQNIPDPFDVRKLFIFTMVYSGFAFILSLVREAVKDIEDMHGDEMHGCKTLPVVAGIQATKIYLGVWLSVMIAAMLIISFYALQSGWWLSAVYAVIFIAAPLVHVLILLKKASLTSDYHQLSTKIKFIMLAGILTMLFFISPYK